MVFKTRKAQAAMEFLMTYGWAILVVLVAIGALAYFGVLSPDKLLPNRCQLQSGLSCDDFTLEATQVQVVIRNGLGYDLSALMINVTNCATAATSASMTNGAQATFTVSGCTLTSGGKFSGDINISYTNDNSGLAHTAQGSMTGRVS